MSADTTPRATFVSEDGLVSFDDKGYRLDSLGNRTYNNAGIWGEDKPRYSKPVQDAIEAYNAEVTRYEAERDAFLAQLQQQPGMWSTPATAATWRQPQNTWAGVSQWQQPGAAQSPISNPQSPSPWANASQWQRPPQPQQPPAPSMPAPQSPPSTWAPIAQWRRPG